MEIMNTFWALVPAIIAIIVALISKEVYVSLFIGILLGGLLIAEFNVIEGFATVFDLFAQGVGFDTNDMANSSYYNFAIIIFLILLGIIIVLVNKSGGAKAYGDWAGRRIKSKKGVLGATIALGVIISVDDYFNNLTVGSIMVPVTDKHKISRTKLAYLVASVAAPICIICPISSWAVAISVAISKKDLNGFSIFLKTIPFNLYALLSLGMLILLTITGIDYGKMKKYEEAAQAGEDLSTSKEAQEGVIANLKVSEKGSVIDLVLPILMLIIVSILMMLYTGGLFDGSHNILEAFGECDSAVSLCCGALAAIITCGILYLPRKILNFKEFTDCVSEGFKSMVPAILILVLAWTLNCVCQNLGIEVFVNNAVNNLGINLGFIPALFFLLALGLAFATGTSWGTFSIFIPLVISLVSGDSSLTVIAIAGVLAGSVCGDHISPISDTTILSSTSSKCDHIIHVKTQMPYALLVALISFIGFIIAGFTKLLWLTLLVSFVLLIGSILLIHFIETKKEKKEINND